MLSWWILADAVIGGLALLIFSIFLAYAVRIVTAEFWLGKYDGVRRCLNSSAAELEHYSENRPDPPSGFRKDRGE